jgi:hypothetical protein
VPKDPLVLITVSATIEDTQRANGSRSHCGAHGGIDRIADSRASDHNITGVLFSRKG